jgi:hypothetical protein
MNAAVAILMAQDLIPSKHFTADFERRNPLSSDGMDLVRRPI